jgi:WD40 repeat protein
MISFQNENILGLIFSNSSLLKAKQDINDSKNKLLAKILIARLDYNNIVKSLGKTSMSINNSEEINFFAILCDGNIITASGKTLKFWNINNLKCIKTVIDTKDIRFILTLLDGNFMTTSDDIGLKLWSIVKGYECTQTISIHGLGCIGGLLLLPNGNIAVINENVKEMKDCISILDNLNNFSCMIKLTVEERNFYYSLVNLNNSRFASSTSSGDIRIWDIANDYECVAVVEHDGCDEALTFLDVFDLLISGSRDKSIKFWDTNSYECIMTIENTHENGVKSLLTLRNGYFASCGYSSIKIWDVKDYKCLFEIDHNKEEEVTCFSLLSDYRLASLRRCDNKITILNY